MKRGELRQVVRYDGELLEVTGIAEGRTIIMKPICGDPCPFCRHNGSIHLLEDSPLFQEHVNPVDTVSE